MFKRMLIFGSLFLLIAFSAFIPTILAQEEDSASPSAEEKAIEEYDFASMTTYEMFWPVVAGKVPGDKYYKLKLWRGKIAVFLTLNKLKKAELLKKMVNKRLAETERLAELERFSLIPSTIQGAKQNLEKGLESLSAAKKKPRYSWLKNEYAKDARKYLVLLGRLKEKISEEEKASVEEFFSDVEELIEKYELKIASENP